MNKLAAIPAAGAIALVAACGSSADSQFVEAYQANSSGAVSVEKAAAFAHDICSALKDSEQGTVLKNLIPAVSDEILGASQEEKSDYKVAMKKGILVFCPSQAVKLSQLSSTSLGGI